MILSWTWPAFLTILAITRRKPLETTWEIRRKIHHGVTEGTEMKGRRRDGMGKEGTEGEENTEVRINIK
jgi:hypothetical protein